MKYFFKKLTEAPEYINGSIIFDQGYINDNIASGKYNISTYHLPTNEAMSGWIMMLSLGIYFKEDVDKSIKSFYHYLVKDKTIMIHFNWMITLFEKEYRQREMLLYEYDEDEYYSSTENKYFEFHYNINSFDLEKKITLFGLNIALLSGRKFIFPKYSCSYINRFTNIKGKKCTFADMFKIGGLSKVKYLFRENVYIILFFILFSHF